MTKMSIRIGAAHNEVRIGDPKKLHRVIDLGHPDRADRAERARTRSYIVREWKRNRGK